MWYALADDGKTPVPIDENDPDKYTKIGGLWGKRHVGLDTVDGYKVSTVFLRTDHNYSGKGPPVLWETMVFEPDSWNEVFCDRYTSHDDAVIGHDRACTWVRLGMPEGYFDDEE